jgi:hypothetical protein
MSGILLASFPNSRIKPRPATTSSDTQIEPVPTGVATIVAPANLNRTTLTIRNLGNTDAYYGYDASIDGSVGTNGGMLIKGLDSVDIDDPGDIYVFQNQVAVLNIAIDEGQG